MKSKYLENTLQFYKESCTNCGTCLKVCPHEVFAKNEKEIILANPTLCMECGACQKNCKYNAIKVESGVGCASAMFKQAIFKKEEATCGCDTNCC